MKMGPVEDLVAAHRRRHSDRRGASLIEACLAMALICMIFLGLFQVSRVLAARDVLNHAAARVARARTVGFDDWMVLKVARVATIPNAGIMLAPVYTNEAPALQAALANDSAGAVWDNVLSGNIWPLFIQAGLEMARIPQYLGSQNSWQAQNTLNYSEWESDSIDVDMSGGGPLAPLLTVDVSQLYPMQVPGSSSFYADGHVPLQGTAEIENHYPLYLEEHP
ncbi:MAG: hypothetical protein HN919_18775 [Verrucomicrobia bacterium]|jgi:hypothetical protein|nr:hypothetical protein [Verrucomicrobiota bacterium]MBT7068349.1 hypothetical protein [Verrucomicrobiota bacterium]MBT7700852.1 hypothetical protein [Verrucomicrobiota bacterium]